VRGRRVTEKLEGHQRNGTARDGGVDGTRTRGLRRDSHEARTVNLRRRNDTIDEEKLRWQALARRRPPQADGFDAGLAHHPYGRHATPQNSPPWLYTRGTLTSPKDSATSGKVDRSPGPHRSSGVNSSAHYLLKDRAVARREHPPRPGPSRGTSLRCAEQSSHAGEHAAQEQRRDLAGGKLGGKLHGWQAGWQAKNDRF